MSTNGNQPMPDELMAPINEREYKDISERLDRELHGDFSRWLTLREAAVIANSEPGKLRYSITTAKAKLEGIKRGPLWFVERGDVITYASVLLERRYAAAKRRLRAHELAYKRAKGEPVKGKQPKVMPRLVDRETAG